MWRQKKKKLFNQIWDRSCLDVDLRHLVIVDVWAEITYRHNLDVYFKIGAFPGPGWLKTKCTNCGEKKCHCFHLCWICLSVFMSFKNTACTCRPGRLNRRESLTPTIHCSTSPSHASQSLGHKLVLKIIIIMKIWVHIQHTSSWSVERVSTVLDHRQCKEWVPVMPPTGFWKAAVKLSMVRC